jgi:hypothetical protein
LSYCDFSFPFDVVGNNSPHNALRALHAGVLSRAHEFPASPEIRTLAETDAFFPPAEPEQKMI